ncbi:hypothetical protein N9D31_01920 [Oligoflexaceae bacterium]|nr:hypothetical protein [Oligoflexaceae bacterium]
MKFFLPFLLTIGVLANAAHAHAQELTPVSKYVTFHVSIDNPLSDIEAENTYGLPTLVVPQANFSQIIKPGANKVPAGTVCYRNTSLYTCGDFVGGDEIDLQLAQITPTFDEEAVKTDIAPFFDYYVTFQFNENSPFKSSSSKLPKKHFETLYKTYWFPMNFLKRIDVNYDGEVPFGDAKVKLADPATSREWPIDQIVANDYIIDVTPEVDTRKTITFADKSNEIYSDHEQEFADSKLYFGVSSRPLYSNRLEKAQNFARNLLPFTTKINDLYAVNGYDREFFLLNFNFNNYDANENNLVHEIKSPVTSLRYYETAVGNSQTYYGYYIFNRHFTVILGMGGLIDLPEKYEYSSLLINKIDNVSDGSAVYTVQPTVSEVYSANYTSALPSATYIFPNGEYTFKINNSDGGTHSDLKVDYRE